jgi:hypothetical protein
MNGPRDSSATQRRARAANSMPSTRPTAEPPTDISTERARLPGGSPQ